MDPFKTILITKTDDGQEAAFTELRESDLMEGNVTVRVDCSTVNFKDGLALTGRSPIIRKFPLIPGIDFAGTVETSEDPNYAPGDKVLVNGWGIGETHHGGYAEIARVPGDWLVPVPQGMSMAETMAVGTAGYTAMLAVLAIEDHGVKPDDGDVLVTGAAGGVGSIAVAVLSKLGYRVIASTGRPEESDYLTGLGAAEIMERSQLSEPGRPLGKERWTAAVDVAGSTTLANVLAQTRRHGIVAACGLAQGMDLPSSVAPFILRGVTLAGMDSVMCPRERRFTAWKRLAADLDPDKLAAMTTTIGFEDVFTAAEDILAGKVRGRIVVKIG